MHYLVRLGFYISFLTPIVVQPAVAAKGGDDRSGWPMLSIRLCDQADVPKEVLRLASAEAGRLFGTAGIRIVWKLPVSEAREDQGVDMTAAVYRPAVLRDHLAVRLIRRAPRPFVPGALGFALPFARTGAHVVIFYDRVEAMTRSTDAPTYVVLGHSLVHELAHVLLRSSTHTSGGLMEGRWTPATWHLAAAGLLAFREEEKEAMRLEAMRLPVLTPVPLQPGELLAAASRRH